MNSSEIAKLAGVSRSTVSRVINNYSNVPEETREKVLKVIKEHDYVPHASARMLAGSKNRVIGLFIIDMKNKEKSMKNRITKSPYFLEFTSSAIETASEMGYTVLVHIIHNEEGYEKIKECYYNKTISGGIFIGQNDGDEYIKEIIKRGYKVILIDQSIDNDDEIYKKCMIVNADNFNGAYNATKYLIDKHHTQIAHITGETTKLSSNDRIRGYKQALKDAGIPINKNLIVNGEFVEKSGYDAVKKLLSKNIKFTAIFASNDKIAFGAIKAIKEAGLKVPEDISVIGFDDIEASKYFDPPLTSIKMELVEMADIAAKSIITSIEDDMKFSANYVIPVTLKERKSCKEIIVDK
ncbi:LacI family DNA-binding transcriptional regulator [Clostridium sp. SM-530-WT-3G]|uniref:LacI family DNA-binding transcriptional regulator n=1 Tax=Clostridium sp. SM-530-WT-3G TaxID=2725303 RepID=UPI00145DCC64|nr:LacI family DNA-binding transcriptional regulator [Clostridium sp. SM-530-WT-3G]NME84089.1 LacI family transcriptional regulator [Clostridium sp. SM-530-WT-3G]